MDAQTNATEIPAATAEGAAGAIGTEPQVNAQPPVADHIIAASLAHPNIQGGPLSRGARYIHLFEVELVSDGRRLWASASTEGKAILDTLAEESRREHDAIEAHRAKQAQI